MAKKQSNPQEIQKQNNTYWRISIGLSAISVLVMLYQIHLQKQKTNAN
ncbi:hypothetical protein JMN10_05195 [Capnocytophaga genosp. AHN8471]|jgi:hypothetical protein|uniref:Uncharacterized protein n=1 Tax=Capnocytophaga genosp. AHN8471 TaxID=327574 RepID=A0ABS1YX95_9FLAO|nr:hypothetical protein [Capnocytophaga genosp. AHN8471]MBM0651034.1 hypothetical protein [Capnocytophaga genosp. AHN8471]MBM0661584.1 hypothetical protein [Capnocytophaga genosp. AHN8471]